MRKKLLSMLVLLTAAAPGAWAQNEVTLTPQGEGAWTLEMPASNVELEVTYFTQAELDQQAADDVVTKINAIGEVAYTEECKARIDAARAAYDALTADQNALITAEQLAVLTDAEAAYEALKPIEFTWDAATNIGTLTMPASDVELEIEYKADLTLSVSIEGWTYGATASVPTVSGNEGNGAVTYEYKVKDAADDTYTADVPTAAGDYTVRATVAETDDYADATATADFTIQKAAATISYETASVSKTFGDADFTNDLTNAGDGIVTYTSDNEDVATVDSETGLVHIVGAGEATITATVTDGTNYTYATKTATFTVDVELEVLSLALSETTDNTDALNEWDGCEADVTLTRTLQTGGYNTFAVPFGMTIPSGWTVKELNSASLSEGVLTLNFAGASSIEAGKPYLVKVDATTDLSVAAITGVIISKEAVPFTSADVDFIPTLGATTIAGDVKSILFLGSGNTLLNPSAENLQIKGFRAYFQLKGETAQANARAFVLNFGDGETTGIITVSADQPAAVRDGIYNLQGRKIEGQPTQKGVYIVNGKKVIK